MLLLATVIDLLSNLFKSVLMPYQHYLIPNRPNILLLHQYVQIKDN